MSKNIRLEVSKATQFVANGAVEALESRVKAAQKALEEGTCAGNDFLGWMHLASSITPEHLAVVATSVRVL